MSIGQILGIQSDCSPRSYTSNNIKGWGGNDRKAMQKKSYFLLQKNDSIGDSMSDAASEDCDMQSNGFEKG